MLIKSYYVPFVGLHFPLGQSSNVVSVPCSTIFNLVKFLAFTIYGWNFQTLKYNLIFCQCVFQLFYEIPSGNYRKWQTPYPKKNNKINKTRPEIYLFHLGVPFIALIPVYNKGTLCSIMVVFARWDHCLCVWFSLGVNTCVFFLTSK